MTETDNTITTNLDSYKAVFLTNVFIQYGTALESISYGFFFLL